MLRRPINGHLHAEDVDLSTLGGADGSAIPGLPQPPGRAGGQFGWSVSAAGDVNGDGYGDIIIGAPAASNGAIGNVGDTYVLFGSATGFGRSFDLTTLNGANGFIISGDQSYIQASGSAGGTLGGLATTDFT